MITGEQTTIKNRLEYQSRQINTMMRMIETGKNEISKDAKNFDDIEHLFPIFTVKVLEEVEKMIQKNGERKAKIVSSPNVIIA